MRYKRLLVILVSLVLVFLTFRAVAASASTSTYGARPWEVESPTGATSSLPIIDDFEAGVPPTWFQYGDYGSGTSIAVSTVVTDTPVLTNSRVLSVTYTSAGWGGGVGNNLGGQDWSAYDGFAFWFKGANTGATFRVIISDNPNPDVPGDSAERFAYEFVDNSSGWRHISIPWGAFFRDYAYQPPGAPNDGLTLTNVQAYAIALPPGTSATILVDDVALFGDVGERRIGFASPTASVVEGNPVTLTVRLNSASPVTVTAAYATVNDTATEADYTPISGTLTIPPGAQEAHLSVSTIDDSTYEGNETFFVVLSNPVNAEPGTYMTATVTIRDNDPVPAEPVSGPRKIVDDYELDHLPQGQDAHGNRIGFLTWNAPGAGVSITATVPTVQPPGKVADNRVMAVTLNLGAGQWAGFTHAFENETLDTWVSQDWSTYEGVSFWLYGHNTGSTLFIDILDNRNPNSTTDDAERWSVDIPDDFTGWKFFQIPFDQFHRKDIGNGAPNDGFGRTEVWGYAFGGFNTIPGKTYYLDDFALYGTTAKALARTVGFASNEVTVVEGETATLTVTVNMTSTQPITVTYRSMESSATPERDYTPISGTLVIPAGSEMATIALPTYDDDKHEPPEGVMVNLYDAQGADLAFQRRILVRIADNDPANPSSIDDFEGFHPFQAEGSVALDVREVAAGDSLALPGQAGYEHVVQVQYDEGASGPNRVVRYFATPQDWSKASGISFWYYGNNTGRPITVELLDNQSQETTDVTPSEWVLRWSDEFDGPAGTLPDANKWRYELGDGALNGIPGWGNSEFEYYTADPENVALDGNGHLRIRVQKVDTATTDLVCYYGPCQYTSARLLTQDRVSFRYGRIEARIKLPNTDKSGLWPAFWSLGDNIRQVGWPQCGEIDIMEYVSRVPNTVFGTIHGPGYSGGSGYGNSTTVPDLTSDFHTFAVEWTEDGIVWYVDGVKYHEAHPTDDYLQGKEWVFDHPFFLLLNMAIGGNFGGAIDPAMTFPQELLVDYVRVYQAPDTAERFQAQFVDNFSGWKRITIPFSAFIRSGEQPEGAPNDGLTLTQVHGYGFRFPAGSDSSLTVTTYIDQVSVLRWRRWLPVVIR